MSMELEHSSHAIEPVYAGAQADFAPSDSAVFEAGLDVPATAVPAPGPRVLARLVEYASGRYIALPPHTTYALIEQPPVEAVPGAAHYAYGLLTWQDARLPLLDLGALLHVDPGTVLSAVPRYALIVAYQSVARGPLAYGAIGMDSLPQTIAIGDEAQCALPEDSRLWPQLALSCFRHEGEAVPILDTARLFAAYHG